MALVAYEDALCPCGCGFPREKAWDDESDGWLVAREGTCYAKAAMDRWQSQHEQTKPEPGVLVYAVDERDEPD